MLQSLVLSGSLSKILELLAQVVDEVVDLGDARAVPQHLLLEVHLVEQCAQVLVGSAHDRVLREQERAPSSSTCCVIHVAGSDTSTCKATSAHLSRVDLQLVLVVRGGHRVRDGVLVDEELHTAEHE